jgi:hypothetical protein
LDPSDQFVAQWNEAPIERLCDKRFKEQFLCLGQIERSPSAFFRCPSFLPKSTPSSMHLLMTAPSSAHDDAYFSPFTQFRLYFLLLAHASTFLDLAAMLSVP